MKFKSKNVKFLLYLFLVGFVTLSCDNDEIDYENEEVQADYEEQYRPQIHFTAEKNWINDPNGMVYLDGEYHLFYQHNPLGTDWGNMSWGHAVSEDLFHWEHLSVALFPDDLGAIFSGSAVIDKNNTAGFGENAMIAIYTSAGDKQAQSLAYSTDNGRSFKKYEGNPVIPNPGINDFRDPKVFWHEESEKWIMSLATYNSITFYGSANLLEWTRLNAFEYYEGLPYGVWECPDLISMDYNGEEKWVLIVSTNGAPNGGTGTQYFVGDFDGNEFIPDNAPYPLWLDYGKDNYAGVTWSNEPQGRSIFMGWMSNWEYAGQTPASVFRGAMTLPRELFLYTHPDGHLIVGSKIVDEINMISQKEVALFAGQVTNDVSLDLDATDAYELSVSISGFSNSGNILKLQNSNGELVTIGYDMERGALIFDRTESGTSDFSGAFRKSIESPVVFNEEILNLQIIVDQSSVEVFVNGGLSSQTNLVFPEEIYNELVLTGENNSFYADVKFKSLKSVWK
ncbi:fructan beta-fructosidase [Marinilabilia salmonicolor]|jgi:fructan beta-fructosidase|uniref:glycoside hydrolase family 32 protein n=1 Tax=Marinilabilia salmonicolor TaxID=989 RepID=UPI000D0499FB|nr:glycoside hydrolase family 32 protein [Marinilabilia salmonicolor]PRY97762.1 fructan beta-fructosidase [Marinilabilia salmonicolor]